MATAPTQGVALEARLQRIFLAQGTLAERRLKPSAGGDRRMSATDIDVLISEYSSGFHLTRRHAECKGGKVAVLDRILWLNGVKTLLGADASYLVLKDVDYDVAQFGRALDVQLLSVKQLQDWEQALKIPEDTWPCRSDYEAFEVALARWSILSRKKGVDGSWKLIREVMAFVEIDSWLFFQYRHLNRLLRYLKRLADEYPKVQSDVDGGLCCRYAIAALLVRLSQYLLAVCHDVMAVAPSDMNTYLMKKLTYGDQDPRHVAAIIEGTVKWVKEALAGRGTALPAEADVERLFARPPHAEEFAELIQRLLLSAGEVTFLPLALEVGQFDNWQRLGGFPRLQAAALAGDSLAALVKGFLVRALSIPNALMNGLGQDLRAVYKTGAGRKGHAPSGEGTQLPLDSH